MRFYSTNNPKNTVDLATAILQSLPEDNGLYMPVEIPSLASGFINALPKLNIREIAYEVSLPYLREDFSEQQIADIINQIDFGAPLESLNYNLHILELWHGPSLAFKDFGARFMAAVISKLSERKDQRITILVATSGDTGGAVASGFLGVDNVDVIILYPSGKVSPIQEKQLTTLGQNITALEIAGSFDDCQALVKKAFLDKDLRHRYNLSSANSINIARLIPQSFYYFSGYGQLEFKDDVVFCIPSGNFGNLTAGLLSRIMGLPIKHFIAAVNANDVIPRYLATGNYSPTASIATMSNAMDVGNPSNFYRMLEFFGGDWATMKDHISAYSVTETETIDTIKLYAEESGYILDPHTAVGCHAASLYLQEKEDDQVIVLGTAHPAKFLPAIEPILGEVVLPEALKELVDREKKSIQLSSDYADFKAWLMR